jgi:hypothetical protein
MGGFPMMQNPMAAGMPAGMSAPGTDAAAAQNQQQYMGMPGFAMPMMYPGNVPGAQGQMNQQNNAGGQFRNKNNDS